jgi:1-acyl-sn-glycerol-3-phosphate acyltransferase
MRSWSCDRSMKPYYSFWRYVLRTVIPLATRIEVCGLEHIPTRGAAILVGNHPSATDPAILLAYVKRPITFIIKSELYDHLAYRIALPGLGPIPVRPGKPDREALRKAEAVLRAGRLLAIYPEGMRSLGGLTQPAHGGVVFLAQRTGAPIIPVAISGSEYILRLRLPYRPAQLRLTIGAPLTLAELQAGGRASREQLANAIMARVAALLPPRRGAIFSGADEPSTHPA